jgi:hypothetical protein
MMHAAIRAEPEWRSVPSVDPGDREREIARQAQRALDEAYAAICAWRADAEAMAWGIAFGSASTELRELASRLDDFGLRRLAGEFAAACDEWVELLVFNDDVVDPSSEFPPGLHPARDQLRARLDRYLQ